MPGLLMKGLVFPLAVVMLMLASVINERVVAYIVDGWKFKGGGSASAYVSVSSLVEMFAVAVVGAVLSLCLSRAIGYAGGMWRIVHIFVSTGFIAGLATLVILTITGVIHV